MIDLARLAGTVHCPEPTPAAVEFAAAELASYLGRIFGTAPRVQPTPRRDGCWLWLGPRAASPPAETGALQPEVEYGFRPAGAGVLLLGRTPRALLAAVYALLEAAGCRWSPEGRAAEHVPSAAEVPPGLEPQQVRPAFARRAWVSDLSTWHYTMPERLAERLPADRAFIDWMAKTGATGFLFIRHANDSQWLVPELRPELERRGLALESGGHVLVELLPRDLIATHPEYFPARADGTRHDFGNMCVSSRAALALVAERARQAHALFPSRADFHLWGVDVLGGGWCACRECAGLSPSDQALTACNAVGETLDARVFHLAYHDTLRAPSRVRPYPNVTAEFAPRERCYGHALDDPACTTNRPYREALESHLASFDGRVDVFEYYADAILFGGCAVPLVETIARDLDYYRRAGVRGVSCLTFGRYSLWTQGVNVEAFARGAITPAEARVREPYCARRYGAAANIMMGYLDTLERLMASVVTYGDVKLPPRDATRAAATERALGAALTEAPNLGRQLEQAADHAPPAAWIDAERRLLDYTFATLGAVRDWLSARRVHDPVLATDARARLAEALAHIHAVEPSIKGTWGTHDLEIAHAFFAAALDAPDDSPDPTD